MRPLAILLVTLLTLPVSASAEGERTGPDLVIELDASSAAPEDTSELHVIAWEPGERISWNITTTSEFRVIEIQATGFGIERPRQLVPAIEVGEPYPLFEHVDYPDIWSAEDAARIAHSFQSGGSTILRLGIPGPANGTLTITRDVTPPTLTPGPRTNATHFSFYQETRTDELALVNQQIRERGEEAWVDNPTPAYHYLQRFPIQGLDPETEYETRFTATDWAENEATIDGGTHRSPAAPTRRVLVITPVAPTPDATIRDTNASIIAEFPQGTALGDGSGIRLFLDKTEVHEDLIVDGERVTYTPASPLRPGHHSVSIEVTTEDGAHGVARWTFRVGGADAPASSLLIGLACLALAVVVRRRP